MRYIILTAYQCNWVALEKCALSFSILDLCLSRKVCLLCYWYSVAVFFLPIPDRIRARMVPTHTIR